MVLSRALTFLGPPGAGKGTQCQIIAKAIGTPHLSTGDMFRDAIIRGTQMGRLVKPIVERGDLVPDDIVAKMVEERLMQADCAVGFVLDGFPRTLPQAERLNDVMKNSHFGELIAVYFEVARKILVRRLCGRYTCSLCGEIYNTYTIPPKVSGICDMDDGELFQRTDDQPEVVQERLRTYERQTRLVTEYYRRQGTLEIVNGSASKAEVTRALGSILNERYRSICERGRA